MNKKSPKHWKGPTSPKEREKWGTPIIYDVGEVGRPASHSRTDPPLRTSWPP
jgi:hypothetical protein